MLQGTRVDKSFTVDRPCVDEQEVVPESKVEEEKADGSEPKHKGCDNGVGDGYDG